MENPSLSPSILLVPMENGYLAYDPTADRIHELNPVASLIVELCDGSRNVGEISAMVTPILPEGPAGTVEQWIDEGIAAGLLSFGGDAGNAHRELSAQELSKVARRLRRGDKEEMALICLQRAAELAPSDPDLWYDLGDLAESLGRRENARTAYEKYIELKPDDAEIKHILIALRDEEPPARMSNETLEQIYAHFSSTYEANVLEDLGYKGPERVREIVEALVDGRRNLDILDLGCGTGLAAVQFRPLAARLIGVDISPEMVELARKRELYDRLEVAEITQWLDRCTENFDVALACDCLIYFGDLRQVTLPVAKLLRPRGLFAFTLERGDRYPHRLADSGRYTHHPDHVREAAADAGLHIVRFDEGFLRTEYGSPVTGLYVALQKPGSS